MKEYNADSDSIRSMSLAATKIGWFMLVSTTCRWCVYKNGEHHSNHVWFFISGNGMTPRCYNEVCRNEWLKSRRTTPLFELPLEAKDALMNEVSKLGDLIQQLEVAE